MKVLAEKELYLGGKWILVEYNENFYAYGSSQELNNFLGVPVNQCGTKEDVLQHCKSISNLCKKNIDNYNRNFEKNSTEGWRVLIDQEKKELEALECFYNILNM